MEYACIFEKDKECPVKKDYKLRPESLVEFCKVCSKHQRSANSEIDLKLEEMRLQHELEMKKIEFDEKTWQIQQVDAHQLNEILKDVLDGPIGKVVESIGSTAKQRLTQGQLTNKPEDREPFNKKQPRATSEMSSKDNNFQPKHTSALTDTLVIEEAIDEWIRKRRKSIAKPDVTV